MGRKWMLESAYQIRANFVDPVYDQKRLRRVVDIINKIKVCLKATTPLGIETEDEEEDKRFLRFMTTNEELIDLGWKLQTEKQRQEEEEEAKRAEKESEEAEDSPPPHGYASKLRKIGGRARGTSATPKRMGKMRPQVTSTPNTQKKREKRPEERKEEVEEVIIQDGAKVGRDPDAHTQSLAEVGCYSNRENNSVGRHQREEREGNERQGGER